MVLKKDPRQLVLAKETVRIRIVYNMCFDDNYNLNQKIVPNYCPTHHNPKFSRVSVIYRFAFGW